MEHSRRAPAAHNPVPDAALFAVTATTSGSRDSLSHLGAKHSPAASESPAFDLARVSGVIGRETEMRAASTSPSQIRSVDARSGGPTRAGRRPRRGRPRTRLPHADRGCASCRFSIRLTLRPPSLIRLVRQACGRCVDSPEFREGSGGAPTRRWRMQVCLRLSRSSPRCMSASPDRPFSRPAGCRRRDDTLASQAGPGGEARDPGSDAAQDRRACCRRGGTPRPRAAGRPGALGHLVSQVWVHRVPLVWW
jgi:hypothetical protein